jgi:hypothetical protein
LLDNVFQKVGGSWFKCWVWAMMEDGGLFIRCSFLFPDGDVLDEKGLNYLTEKSTSLGIDLLEDHQWDNLDDSDKPS